jgi:MFS family permease
MKDRKDDIQSGLKRIFRALSHKNYRLFFGGQSISLIGTWMQQVAMNWLVYRLSHSALLLGVVGFTGRAPTFFLASLAGVYVDRWNRRRILIATQTLAMIQALILAALVLAGGIAVWHIVLLSIVLGIVNAFDVPARQAFVIDMVGDKENLGNAIALNSSMVNGARLVGPSIAGVLIGTAGEGTCFLLNGLSYIAVIASLLAMEITSRKRAQPSPVWSSLKEGFAYAFGFPPIRSLLLLLALVSLMGMPYVVLMPIFAENIHHGGAQALGFLLGASGVGALAGAIYLASRKSVLGLGRIIVLASSTFGAGLVLFSLSRLFAVSLALLAVVGFGMMVQMTSTNTILQTMVDEDKRGRVMSFYTMAFMGMVPFGNLLAGGLASVLGAPETVMMGGFLCILGSVAFAIGLPSLRKMARPVYVTKGVISEEPSEITDATGSDVSVDK